MRTRRQSVPTWKALVPLWVGALGASILFGNWVGAQGLPDEGVSCDPNELVYSRIHDFPAQAFEDETAEVEDAETPEVALDEFLKKAYPKLNKSEFKKTKQEGSEAKFKKEKDGKSVAEVLVQKVGDSWEVGKFTACNSVAEEGSD
ncbi:MAG: hypothetical protein M3271_12295 [Actinomycetota bacterium]|nr:hypothetical protein [Actinomycetota bacterium]